MAVIKDGNPIPPASFATRLPAKKGYRDNARFKYYIPRYNDPLECFRDQRAYDGGRGRWRVSMVHFWASW